MKGFTLGRSLMPVLYVVELSLGRRDLLITCAVTQILRHFPVRRVVRASSRNVAYASTRGIINTDPQQEAGCSVAETGHHPKHSMCNMLNKENVVESNTGLNKARVSPWTCTVFTICHHFLTQTYKRGSILIPLCCIAFQTFSCC